MNQLHPQDLLWCVKRLPRDLIKLLKENPSKLFVAGGYIRSRITNEEVNDIDLFVKDKEDAKLVALAYAIMADRQAEVTPEVITVATKRLFTTDNAITIKGSRPTVQVIHRWTFDTPKDCIASFDFTIACAAFWWDGEKWDSACHPEYYQDLAAKRLIYTAPTRMEDAGGSMLRVLKFYQRGYRIPINSLGRVVARLMKGVKPAHDEARANGVFDDSEEFLAKIVTGLLHEVDPNIDPDHIAHLPSTTEPEKPEEGV